MFLCWTKRLALILIAILAVQSAVFSKHSTGETKQIESFTEGIQDINENASSPFTWTATEHEEFQDPNSFLPKTLQKGPYNNHFRSDVFPLQSIQLVLIYVEDVLKSSIQANAP